MPRKFIKQFMPHPSRITENSMIKKLGPRLQDPGIWHINRRSVSGAIALGLFCAFIPVPFQMFLAAIGAILFRVNILIAVPTVWVSNPFTIPPLFFFCYQVGVWILGSARHQFNFELSFAWLANELSLIWQPFLLGCFVVASVSALAGFISIRMMWRYSITQHIKLRKLRTFPKLRKKKGPSDQA
jgi:hypothetical protein